MLTLLLVDPFAAALDPTFPLKPPDLSSPRDLFPTRAVAFPKAHM